MNLLAAMCWLSRDATEGTETRSNRVRRARGGEELTGRKAPFHAGIRITQRNVLIGGEPDRISLARSPNGHGTPALLSTCLNAKGRDDTFGGINQDLTLGFRQRAQYLQEPNLEDELV